MLEYFVDLLVIPCCYLYTVLMQIDDTDFDTVFSALELFQSMTTDEEMVEAMDLLKESYDILRRYL